MADKKNEYGKVNGKVNGVVRYKAFFWPLVFVIITLGNIIYANVAGGNAEVRTDIRYLRENKLEKTEYYRDMEDLNKRFDKIDKIYDYLILHDERTKKAKSIGQ